MNFPVFKSKEELKAYLKEFDLMGIDSEFSNSTLALISDFKALGAHVNKWWVMTSVEWVCPSCKRSKPEIVRINKHGFLMAHLHEHHDHMKDLVKKRFDELSSSKDVVVADQLAEKFAVRTAYAMSAYDNTVICSDCNGADKNAKKAANTHPDFSYSPVEIGQLIISNPNQEHEINVDIAKKIWHDGEELFKLRLKILNYLAGVAANNTHWYQPSDRTAIQIERQAKYWLNRYGLKEIDCEPEKLLYTSVRFEGEKSSWRKKVNPLINNRPTNGELQHLIQTRGNFWKKVDDYWNCPCCGRKKIECIRPSRKKYWVFEIKIMGLFSETADRWIERRDICNDCANVAIHIGREVAGDVDIYPPSSLVSINEIRAVIISRPYSLHNINNKEVDNIIPTLINRLEEQKYYMSPRCNNEFPNE